MGREILRLAHLRKDVAGTRMLQDVHLTLHVGECHGVLMHSDPSRRLLVDLLTGLQTPDEGTLFVDDTPVCMQNARAARALGIYCIRAQSQLIPGLSIAENLFLTNDDYYSHGFANKPLMFSMARDMLQEANLPGIDPEKPALSLSTPEMHLIELLKNLANSPRILILDNIFHDYTQREFSVLSTLLSRRLPDCSVLFFSSRSNPLFQIAQRITVFRRTSTAITLSQHQHPIDPKTLLAYQSPKKTALPQPEAPKRPTARHILSTDDIAFTPEGQITPITLHEHEVLGLIDEGGSYVNHLLAHLLTPYKKPRTTPKKTTLADALRGDIAARQAMCIPSPGFSKVYHNLNLTENVVLTMHGPTYNKFGLSNRAVQDYAAREALFTLGAENLWESCHEEPFLPHITRRHEFIIQLARCLCSPGHLLVLINPHLYFDDLSIRILPFLIDTMRHHIDSILIVSINRDAVDALCDRQLVLRHIDTNHSFSR